MPTRSNNPRKTLRPKGGESLEEGGRVGVRLEIGGDPKQQRKPRRKKTSIWKIVKEGSDRKQKTPSNETSCKKVLFRWKGGGQEPEGWGSSPRQSPRSTYERERPQPCLRVMRAYKTTEKRKNKGAEDGGNGGPTKKKGEISKRGRFPKGRTCSSKSGGGG